MNDQLEELEAQIKDLNENLLRKALITTDDIRKCPNNECSFAGYVPIDPDSGAIECLKPFKCDMCNTEWLDPL